jgi:serine phosphatase RsbU (regulator of sigma subunit)
VGIQSDITELRRTKVKLENVNQKLYRFRERITRDLDRARLMQHFILPHQLPNSTHLDFASLFVPMEEIGGDFFDVIELQQGIYGLLIADVTGHGIPAALLTFMSSTTFKNSAPGLLSTAAAITQTNQKLFQKMPDDAFVTMFYAIYNTHTKKLTYTQAGHPEAYVLRKDSNEIIQLRTNNTLVGIFSNDEVTYAESSLTLQQGDKLILYTDAISDALNHGNKLNDSKEFQTFLKEHAGLSMKKLFAALYRHGLLKMKKKSYEDDFTLLGFEVTKGGVE